MFDAVSPQQRRLHRTQAANFLVALNASCSLDELRSIDWDALTAVPHWCFLEPGAQRYLQLLSGAVFVAPAMHQWIEGDRIRQACELLGQRAFARVLSLTEAGLSPAQTAQPDVESQLLQGGAAVLTGSIVHPAVATLVSSLFDTPVSPLTQEVATPVYNLALKVFDEELAAMDAAASQAPASV